MSLYKCCLQDPQGCSVSVHHVMFENNIRAAVCLQRRVAKLSLSLTSCSFVCMSVSVFSGVIKNSLASH